MSKDALTLFWLACTQLRVGGLGGILGFDYPAWERPAKTYGFDLDDPDFFDRIRVIEEEFLAIMSEDQKSEEAKRKNGNQNSTISF